MKHFRICTTLLLSLLSFIFVNAQVQTVGLFINEPEAFVGYNLFTPMSYSTTYLIDNRGRLIHSWSGKRASTVYLLENGNLLGGGGSEIWKQDWNGNNLWSTSYGSDEYDFHHDIEPLPNGNVFVICTERISESEAIAAGREPGLITDGYLSSEVIIEVEPTGSSGGNIVWEWHVWDHLIQDYDSQKDNYDNVADYPGRIDLNYVRNGAADWHHANGIGYNAELDQIILSSNFNCEVWVIDHSTTTQQAAGNTGGTYGKGGELLYRYGNPAAYSAGNSNDKMFFNQHNPQWVKQGLPGESNIMVFNNGRRRPDNSNYSSADEIAPPYNSNGGYILQTGSQYGPESLEWTWEAPVKTDFYCPNMSGVERMPNGNTLICHTNNGIFHEVTPDGDIVWKYINPVTDNGPLSQGDPVPVNGDMWTNSAFRCNRYAPDYPAFDGKDMTPGDPLEKDPWVAVKPEKLVNNKTELKIFNNSFNKTIRISFNNPSENAQVTIVSVNGKVMFRESVKQNYLTWSTEGVSSGVYVVKVLIENDVLSHYIHKVN